MFATRFLILPAGIPILMGLAAAQSTLDVPGQYSTIQAAIGASVDGDRVLVAPGTYFENIDYLGKSITVISSAGAALTAVDGNQSGTVVTFENDEGPGSVLDGFTITHGLGISNGQNTAPGGVLCSGASPTLIRCTFEGNRGAFYDSRGGGGAMACLGGSSPNIVDCTFRENVGGDVGDVGSRTAGPGAVRLSSSSPTIIGCTFDSNVGGDCGSADSSKSGTGAIYGSGQCSPEISGCSFTSNMGGDAGSGVSGTAGAGGLFFQSSSNPTIETCTFAFNVGGTGGTGGSDLGGAGAAQFQSNSNSTILDCTFTANVGGEGGVGHSDSGGAGALWFSSGSTPNVSDCVFTSNVGGNGGPGGSDEGGGGAIHMTSSATGTIQRSTFIGNQGGDCAGPNGQGGAGAIQISSNASPFIRDCMIRSNIGGVGGAGSNATGGAGAITTASGASPRIENTLILRNLGGISGPGNVSPQYDGPGAFQISSGAQPILTNCIIAYNVGADGATESDWGGAGALRCSSSGSPTVTNCTIVFNQGGTAVRNGMVGAGGVQSFSNARPTLTNSILWGNRGGLPYTDEIRVACNNVCGHDPVITYSLVAGGYFGTGNLAEDPLLADPRDGNYHILCGSPCVDAGLGSAPELPLTDLDGEDRVLGATVDIGAYEYDGIVLGFNYCQAVANSTGFQAGISASDCDSLAQGNLVLTAAPVPDAVGVFIFGRGSTQTPFANGFLCISGPHFRLPSVVASGNTMTYALDLAASTPPNGIITPGSTWYFQAWYRDRIAGGAESNLTDGLSITFAP